MQHVIEYILAIVMAAFVAIILLKGISVMFGSLFHDTDD